MKIKTFCLSLAILFIAQHAAALGEAQELSSTKYQIYAKNEKRSTTQNNPQATLIKQSALAANSFSFAGISWTDTLENVKSKVAKSGLFGRVGTTGTRSRYCDWLPGEVQTADGVLRGLVERQEQCQGQSLSWIHAVPDLRKSDESTPVNKGYFVFSSVTNKLLYYVVLTKLKSNNAVLESLIQKYGNYVEFGPQRPQASWAKWTSANELLYFNNASQCAKDCGGAVYINVENFEEHLSGCSQASQDTMKGIKTRSKAF